MSKITFSIPTTVGVKFPEGTFYQVRYDWTKYGQEDETYLQYTAYARFDEADDDASWVITRYYWVPSQILAEGRVLSKIRVKSGAWTTRTAIDWGS